MPESSPLPESLRSAMRQLAVRRPDLQVTVHWHDLLPSTMDAVAAAADAGAPAGYVVVADEQSAGRGRRGHSWVSPAGAGLYCSYLARPRRDTGLVTLAAGVAVRAALGAATGLFPALKWPNDLLVGSRKIGGILAEGTHVGTSRAHVVIGVGINVESPRGGYPRDLAGRVASVGEELGVPVDRVAVFTAVVEHLADTLRALEAGHAGDILHAWRAASPLAAGATVRWTHDGVEVHGITAGIDETGALLVETADGVVRVIAGALDWGLD